MQPEATPTAYAHDAFISYSRKDESFADALEQALENYKLPKDLSAQVRFLDIFRDKKDFTAGAYHQNLDRHLKGSRKLIVVCAPNARKSQFVDDEITRFAQFRGAEHIIPVLLSGIPNNEARPGQEEAMAFPKALCRVMDMPLAATYLGFDARKDKPNKGVFEDSWFTILANLYEISRSEIEQREKRKRARTRRVTYSVLSGSIVVLSLLLIFAIVSRSQAITARNDADAQRNDALTARNDADTQRNKAVESAQEAERERLAAVKARDAEKKERRHAEEQTVIASKQRDIARQQTIIAGERRIEAEHQKEIALNREKIADSRRLAAQALNQMGTRLDLALLLAVESSRVVSTAEARSSLVKVLQSAPGLVTFLHGHTGAVTSVAFSPDGKTIASGGADRTVRLWDVAGHALSDGPLYTHKRESSNGDDAVRALAFSPDGHTLASGTLEASLRFADVKSLRPLGEEIEFGGSVNTLAFTPDSKRLAVGAIGLSLFDVASRQEEDDGFTVDSRSYLFPNAAAFSPDGHLLAADTDKGLFLFDVKTRQPISKPLEEGRLLLEKLVFSPDGNLLAVGGGGGKVQLWNVETRSPVGQPLEGDGIVLNLAFTENGKKLALARSDGSVRVWNIETWSEAALPIFVGPISSMAFSPDEHTLVLGGSDGSIRIWDTQPSHHPLGESVPTGPWLDGVAFSPNGKLMATGGDRVILWDAASRKQLRDLNDDKVLSLAFGPDNRTLFTAGEYGVKVWNLETDTAFTLPNPEKEPYNWSLALSPDGKTLAFGGKGLTLWDVINRRPLPNLAGSVGSVRAVAISPDGEILAAGGEDKNIHLWRLHTGSTVGSPLPLGEEAWALAFSPDGRLLATGGDDGKLQLWDTRTLQPIGDPLPGHHSRIRSIAFSPDGTLLASAGFNRKMIVFNLSTREPLGDPFFSESEYEVISGLAFSPDGRLLVGSERRQQLHFFDGDAEAWKLRACRIANRILTAEEWSRYIPNQPYEPGCQKLPLPATVNQR